MVGFGAFTTWDSLVSLPHKYDQLRSNGTQATAYLVVCAPGIGGGRGIGCRLRLSFDGQTRTWAYPEDSGQFEQLRPGAPVTMLVDPADPATAYTMRDVEARTNAGWSPPALFGVALTLIGLVALTWLARMARQLRGH